MQISQKPLPYEIRTVGSRREGASPSPTKRLPVGEPLAYLPPGGDKPLPYEICIVGRGRVQLRP